jgi:hypothetical protein
MSFSEEALSRTTAGEVHCELWSAAACRRFQSGSKLPHSKGWRVCLRPGLMFVGFVLAPTSIAHPAELSSALERAEVLRREHANAHPTAPPIDYRIDPALGHAEAFRLEREQDGAAAIRVIAGGDAGVLYGVNEVLREHTLIGAEGAPDFAIRGAVLMMLSASWNYQSDLSPEVYPWFFDRALMTRYLDYLESARLNTLVLWSGHLFPHILELPEYPDASQFTRDEIRRNQEQFRWLATECARRNITVLTHFYNIHISEHQARALGREGNEAARYTEPDYWVRGYYATILRRYFEEFPSVGLYICPGESLAPEHQQAWFRDVIFRAARESGKNPKLIIRDWTLDPGFKAALPSLYENLFSELKHNDETITSPWPDEKHLTWRGVLGGHIVNLHDPADAVPYRVGSPRLVGEMVRHWKDTGFFNGAWFYPPQAWIWPGTLDIVGSPARPVLSEIEGERRGPAASAAGYTSSETLLAFERDELWHLLEGRYLWKAAREPAEEQAWAAAYLGRKFGNDAIGPLLVDWYDLTAPILPGLQNLTAVRFGNFFPTSIAWVQATVDDILSFRTRIDDQPVRGTTGLTKQRYYSRPIDMFTVERYRARYGLTESLQDLRSMPVAQYAEELAAGRMPEGYVLPDRLLDLYLSMANASLDRAQQAQRLTSNDPDEIRCFAQDSQCLVYTVEYYRHKVLAALAKRLLELTGDEKHGVALRRHMRDSVTAYERMFTYAQQFYRAGSSMWDAKSWERCFNEKVKPDYEAQLAWLAARVTPE